MNGQDPRTTRPLGSGGPTGTQMMPDAGAPQVPGFGGPAPGAAPQAPYPGAAPQAPYPGAAPQAPYPAAAPQAPYPGGYPGGPAPGAPMQQAAPMPAAPTDRRGELQQSNRTVYEFTGAAAASETASRGTFMGATLDLSGHKEVRESNLSSGASTWIFLAVAVVCALGVTGYFVLFQADGASASGGDEAAPAAVADEAKADEAKADDATADDAKADDAKADDPDDAKADDTKADDTKADDTKADDTKADEPKPDEPKPDEPSPDDPPKTAAKTTKKPTTTKKRTTTKPRSNGKTLSPKKPPRDPLKGLPKPP